MVKQAERNPAVDRYAEKATKWGEETKRLRKIALGFPLTEELKWGKPCYTCEGSNILIIQGFKEYCALMFCKGALLKDGAGLLIQQTPNVQAGRQLRFTSVREIARMEPVIKSYIEEAIAAEKGGLKVEFKRNPEPVPEELQKRLDGDPKLNRAFQALTPGRQRGYILYFSAAKQPKTREARIDKCAELILKGKGLHDD